MSGIPFLLEEQNRSGKSTRRRSTGKGNGRMFFLLLVCNAIASPPFSYTALVLTASQGIGLVSTGERNSHVVEEE